MAQITIDEDELKAKLKGYGAVDQEVANFMQDLTAPKEVPNGKPSEGGEPKPEQAVDKGAVPPTEPEAPKEAPKADPSQDKPEEAKPDEAQKGGEPQPKPSEPIQPNVAQPKEAQPSPNVDWEEKYNDLAKTVEGLAGRLKSAEGILASLGTPLPQGSNPAPIGANPQPEPHESEESSDEKKIELLQKKAGMR
ncbi:MAG: hypothetical protein BWY98_01053 [Tenericutes bacterium ADurb.BinA155]|jgi:hypothetical protein|nr:MAG: hypothetical protein BWY98_01053 [Tenericutes bacterium ADurb.BinA155]